MKKIYLSICAIAVAVTSFAQQNDVKTTDFSLNTSKFHWYTSNEDVSKAPPFWTDDLSDASLWTMTDYAHAGTQNWVIGTAAPSGSFSNGMGAIASTTAANGFAMYDSDALATSAANAQDATLAFNNSIDCSLYQYVNLSFESYHRVFHDSVFVEVSNDNINWDRYQVHSDLGVNDASDNPEVISVNISSTAGNQATVWFRFRYEGEWDYAWMLDDVSISETPNNAASISDAVQGGWWVNYANVAGGALAGFDFTFNTNSQLAVNPYSFEAVLHNNGVAPQNMMLHAEVFNDQGTSVFTSTSNSILLDMSHSVDTFACNNTFTPTVNGVYEMRIWGVGDSIVTDTAILISVVNDDIYGRDWNQAAGSWRVGRDCGGMVLGTSLDIYANETVYALQVHIDAESVIGTSLFVALYENDASGDPVYLTQSDDYTLTANDLDNWITVPFDGGQDVFAGTSYLATVGGYANPVDTFQVSVSGNSQGATCWIQDNGCNLGSGAFGDWYWISDIPMIRMSFDPASLDVDNVIAGEFNIFPNPNNGVFTVELNNVKADDYKITVTNILGETVYTSSKEITTLTSERIDLSDLSKGIYMLEVSNSESTISEKIIIE
ncbi:MAG: T9SS type A sorting domain-containing protein [Flavobacteriales bacterium]|nr:T9SS type A sorting domain-containing protein [Flavobacteriales bacterium]MBT6808125.1 T9SS type A sorting domain-containing protein [Flavobacteriales bacterium]